MAFVPRTFEQILSDMIAYVQANSELTDFSVGSVIRTLLEAAAIEDDEQYFQMIQLLDFFSVVTARGADLDRRLADFNLVRLPERPAVVPVRFFNRNLITQQLAADAVATATSIVLFSTGSFPTSGYPYTVRVAEGTARVQDLSVTNNNTSTGTLTVSALTNGMFVGDRCTLVDPASSYTINIGTVLRTVPTASQSSRTFATVEPAYILSGNFYSNEVLAKAQQPGTGSNIGTGRISQFLTSAPFPGAGVTNAQAASSGRDRETDEEFRERGLNKLQSLSRGTPLACRTGVVGVEDRVTGQTVVSASLIEDFDNDEVIVYIDDGSGLDPASAALPADSLTTATVAGVSTSVTLYNASDWPSSGTVMLFDTAAGHEVIDYTTISGNTLNLSSATTYVHAIDTLAYFVETVTAAAENGQRRFRLKHFPVVRGSLRLFISDGPNYVELVEGTDFLLNKGTGDFQIVDDNGLDEGTSLYATYNYYTNIIAEAQKVLEGDVASPTAYPGIKAAGIFMTVEAPIVKRVTVRVSITAASGYSEASLVDSVQANIEAYVNSRKIGEDVIRSKIIDVAHNVRGVADVVVLAPTSNIVVLDNELPVAYDSSGNTLVTVI